MVSGPSFGLGLAFSSGSQEENTSINTNGNRYISLYNECIKRGFNVQNYIGAWDNVPEELMNNYKVKANDIRIIRERINERTINRKNKTI